MVSFRQPPQIVAISTLFKHPLGPILLASYMKIIDLSFRGNAKNIDLNPIADPYLLRKTSPYTSIPLQLFEGHQETQVEFDNLIVEP